VAAGSTGRSSTPTGNAAVAPSTPSAMACGGGTTRVRALKVRRVEGRHRGGLSAHQSVPSVHPPIAASPEPGASTPLADPSACQSGVSDRRTAGIPTTSRSAAISRSTSSGRKKTSLQFRGVGGCDVRARHAQAAAAGLRGGRPQSHFLHFPRSPRLSANRRCVHSIPEVASFSAASDRKRPRSAIRAT